MSDFTTKPNRLDPARVRELLIASGGRVVSVARELGCNHATVCYWREKLGIPVGDRGRKVQPDVVRRLHADVCSDTEIAQQIGCTRTSVKRCREKLGLAPHGKQSPRYREKQRVLFRQKCQEFGVNSLVQLRTREQQQEKTDALASRYGLPPGLFKVQLKILLALTSGPKTAAELAVAAGRTMLKQANPYHRLNHAACDGGNYLTDLCRRGLIARVATARSRPGPGKGESVFSLTAAALEMMSHAHAD